MLHSYTPPASWSVPALILFLFQQAHRGSISTAQFLSSQPVLVTTGADNSVKM